MNRDQHIRDMAYSLWEQEGRPDGRAAQHWSKAETLVEPAPAEKAKSARRTTKTTSLTVKSGARTGIEGV